MAEQSRFFGSSGGDIRQYNQIEFAEVMERFLSNGVVPNSGNLLAVTQSTPQALSVRIDTGKAFVNGYYYSNTTAFNKALGTADVTNPRIDVIVLRLNVITTRLVTIEVLQGTPAPVPVAPAVTQNTTVWEIALAQVLVNAGTSTIVNANITSSNPAKAVPRNISASTSEPGTVQLNNTYPSTSTTTASTPNAVKTGDDLIKALAQMTKITLDTGAVTISLNTASDDILASIVSAGIGLNTLFFSSVVINNPDGANSFRGFSHITGTGNGYALVVGTDRSMYVNNYTGGIWGGWDAISPKSYGLGTTALGITGTDLNNLDQTGWFSGSGLTNAPLTFTAGQVMQIRSSSATSKQMFYTTTTPNRIFTRNKTSSVWGAWTEIQTLALTTVDGSGLSITGTDLNTLDQTGFFNGSSLTNAPLAFTSGFVEMIRSSSATARQHFYPATTNNRIFTRTKISSAWSAWTELQTIPVTTTDGLAVTVTSTDLNNLDTTGFYQGTGLTNFPPQLSVGSGYIINQKISATVRKQIFTPSDLDRHFTRYQLSGVWQTWQEIGTSTPVAWTNFTLQNSWVVLGSSNVSYRKNTMGYVEVRGIMANGTATQFTVLCNLPVGFRPTQQRAYIVPTGATTFVKVGIETNGDIRLLEAVSNNSSLSLDNIPPISIH